MWPKVNYLRIPKGRAWFLGMVTAREALPWVEFYSTIEDTIIFIQPVTVMMLDVIIKGVIFIHTNRGLRLSHFNTHIQISEEQCMFIDHFLVPHYEGYFKNAQCMLVVWTVLDLGKYLTFHHPLHISNKLTFSVTVALLYIHTNPWLLSFPK